MFPHVVTLYNAGEEGSPHYVTILRGVLLDAVRAQNVNENGLAGADAVTLYIPRGAEAADGVTGAPKQYLDPHAFWRTEDRTGFWTLTTGEDCFFVKGEAVHPSWSAQKLEAVYDGVYSVNAVDCKEFGGGMSHWEVHGS